MKMLIRALTHPQARKQSKNTPKRVLYIDTDTTFTAYLKAGLILTENYVTSNDNSWKSEGASNHNYNNENNNKSDGYNHKDDNSIIDTKSKYRDERLVQVFLPSEGRFESLLGDAIASMPEASIVIFDSINSFYNMYPGPWYETEIIKEPAQSSNQKAIKAKAHKPSEQLWTSRANQKKTPQYPPRENTNPIIPPQKTAKGNEEAWYKPKMPYTIGRLNHLLSIFIMLLVQHGIHYKIPVLVTSMVRYKKMMEDLWVKAPACRRLLNQKSVVRLSIEMLNDNDLSVNIMKHPLLEQQTIVYPNVGISLVSP
jgi:hypothetical protein